MDLEIFNKMDESGLRRYIEFLLWHYRAVDAFWFLFTEDTFGRKTAEKVNGQVWERISPMASKELINLFKIEQKGLEGLVKALKLFPWTNIGRHRIETRENEVILTAPECPPQVARIKEGLGEYDCKDMHMKVFKSFIREVDPQIDVECVFAPPDKHPDHLFCKWRFIV